MSYLSFMDEASAANRILLLHANDDYVDSTSYAHVMTARGSMAFASTGAFDGKGLLFNGSSRIDTPHATEFELPVGSVWSIDMRIYIPSSATLATDNTLMSMWKTGQESWYFGLTTTGIPKWFTKGTSFNFDVFGVTALPRNTLLHLAVWRPPSVSVVICAVDGTRIGSAPDRARAASTAKLVIGATDDPGAYLPNGIVIDEVSMCIDAIDYENADFTPGGPY